MPSHAHSRGSCSQLLQAVMKCFFPKHCPTDPAASAACGVFEFPGLFNTMISSEILFSQGNLKYQLDGLEGSFRV